MRTKCTRRIQFSKWPADIKISKVISTLRWAAQRGNEKENTYINACMCVYSGNLYVHWGNKYTRLPRNIRKVSFNYFQFLCLPHIPIPSTWQTLVMFLRVWGQSGVCVIRLLLLLMSRLLSSLQLMNIWANEAKEPPMLRFCVMNSDSKCVVLISTFKQFVFVCLFDWSAQRTRPARPDPMTVACVCSRKPNSVTSTLEGT